jgi:hypothetical protein
MRYLAIFCLILFLTLSYSALAGLQLSGAGGRAVLESLAVEVGENLTNQSSDYSTANVTAMNSSENSGDLWSWGKIPVGHMLNGSGTLVEAPTQDGPLVVVIPH